MELETDSLVVVMKIKSLALNSEPHYKLISTIRDFLNRGWSFSKTHVHREVNNCAG